MNRQEYRSLLGLLPIKNPSVEDVARLCPHLTREQLETVFTTGEGYVAAPPLRVYGAFQILSYCKERIEQVSEWQGARSVVTGNKHHPPQIDRSFAGRTDASYVTGDPRGIAVSEYAYARQAIEFASVHWPAELVLDDWVSAIQFYVQDPTDLFSDRYHKDSPRTKAMLYVTLNCDWNKIINDHTRPQSQLIDEAIVEMTLDPAVWHEIKGERPGGSQFNCAHCGAGLGLHSCTGCGYSFRDDHFRTGWNTPLSPKMAMFLRESGHDFKVDPEVIWDRELMRWERLAGHIEF